MKTKHLRNVKTRYLTSRTPKLTVVISMIDAPGLTAGDLCLYLGEIPNMLGHCAVVTFDRREGGRVLWGCHLDSFRYATEDEL